ncbi:hypothetical protein OG440_32510 [Streptomyces sp. NBC_00637]|uniref:hypothetical protein n=1 Tax=Streptomyces sp. NBC_00637 TaxID=2903667 RepID=UPI00325402EE
MFPWIMWSVVLLAPFVVGGTLAFRTARRAVKADRAMRVLAERPGWRRLVPDGDGPWAGYAGHFPWLLRTRYGTAVAGPLGEHPVTVARLWEPVGRRDMRHWLVVCFDVADSGPMLRLERHWSAAELDLRFSGEIPYLVMSDDRAAMTERFYASDLPRRLTRCAAPAVSHARFGVCFAFPMPDVADMDALLDELAAMVPDLAALARSAAPAAPEKPQDAS